MDKGKRQPALRDRIEDMPLLPLGRYDPTPRPYMLHIRERVYPDGAIDLVHRKRVYGGLVHAVCDIVTEFQE